jgi:hypothetical protein
MRAAEKSFRQRPRNFPQREARRETPPDVRQRETKKSVEHVVLHACCEWRICVLALTGSSARNLDPSRISLLRRRKALHCYRANLHRSATRVRTNRWRRRGRETRVAEAKARQREGRDQPKISGVLCARAFHIRRKFGRKTREHPAVRAFYRSVIKHEGSVPSLTVPLWKLRSSLMFGVTVSWSARSKFWRQDR